MDLIVNYLPLLTFMAGMLVRQFIYEIQTDTLPEITVEITPALIAKLDKAYYDD